MKKDIAQWMYTAGDAIKDSSFAVYSKSNSINGDLSKVIFSLACKMLDGKYEEEYYTQKVLKEGAKPGLFKRYKDTDYEDKRILSKPKIEIISYSKTKDGEMRKLVDYEDDFRADPSKAPYRVGYSTLENGDIVVLSIHYVNKVYSNMDTRNGNFFVHAYVIPKEHAAEFEQNAQKIHFKAGINLKLNQKSAIVEAEARPVSLPEVSFQEIIETQEKKNISPANQSLLIQKAADLFTESNLGKNYKARAEKKYEYRNFVKDNNISEIFVMIELAKRDDKQIQIAKQKNIDPNKMDYTFGLGESLFNTDRTNVSAFLNMLNDCRDYVSLKRSYYKEESDSKKKELEMTAKYIIGNIEHYLEHIGLEESRNMIDEIKGFIELENLNAIQLNNKSSDILNNYPDLIEACSILERTTKKMIEENQTFEEAFK